MTSKQTFATIRKNEAIRLGELGIHPMKIRVRRGVPISYVNETQALSLIERECEWDCILGEFIVKGVGSIPGTDLFIPYYTAIDNKNGNCWCEDFYNEGNALRWIVGEFIDADQAHVSDIRSTLKFLESTHNFRRSDREAAVESLKRELRSLVGDDKE